VHFKNESLNEPTCSTTNPAADSKKETYGEKCHFNSNRLLWSFYFIPDSDRCRDGFFDVFIPEQAN
jgi:hypothetical protein